MTHPEKSHPAWNKGLKGKQSWMNTEGLGKNIDFKKRGKSISKGKLGVKFSEEHKKNLSKKLKENWLIVEYRVKQCESQKGRKVWNKGVEMPDMQRENSWNWKGGVRTEAQIIRHSVSYKTWRLAVFERDNYTCRGCGQRGVFLECHHIKSFADYPNMRFIIDNGISYCQSCHAKNDPKRMKTLSKIIKKHLKIT